MPLIEVSSTPVVLRLNRDLVRLIKRGNPWVYADALRELPRAPAGTPAVLLDNRKGQAVARGFYDPRCPVALRICETDPELKLDDRWAERRLRGALDLRRGFSCDGPTNGFRLLNGEGDSVPGVVADVYSDTAVVKLDGEGPAGFWKIDELAEWLAREQNLPRIYERQKERGAAGRPLVGTTPAEPVSFREHGLEFTADVVRGQKTGFFLDQRDNRQLIRAWSRDATVLNVFSYTGGFSIAAGAGGATQVTSVDVAPAAIEAANTHWRLNGFPADQHTGVAADAFEFLAQASSEKRRWQLVVLDPPSFAPNRESVPKAKSAYQNVIEAGARVTARQGLLAVASCSSHIDLPMFLECCEEGISRARRRGTVINVGGQPTDHPTPLALPEFRYLKFVLLRLD
ncbi:class I SAM-dependent rRNA methyltransferase [Schlesneria sp. T3-172]|uniref:class I SAM-dependent rRNA methyltransferase n=1 Tax=Schlesneria sphaerica TaxID=3373610 RepID=UPI0037CB7C70